MKTSRSVCLDVEQRKIDFDRLGRAIDGNTGSDWSEQWPVTRFSVASENRPEFLLVDFAPLGPEAAEPPDHKAQVKNSAAAYQMIQWYAASSGSR